VISRDCRVIKDDSQRLFRERLPTYVLMDYGGQATPDSMVGIAKTHKWSNGH